MSFFVTIVTYDLIYIFFPPFVVTNLCFVGSNGRVGKIPLGFVLFFLFILPNLIKKLEILGGSRYKSLSLRFIPATIFHCSISLDFFCGSVRRLTSLEDLLIGLLYI